MWVGVLLLLVALFAPPMPMFLAVLIIPVALGLIVASMRRQSSDSASLKVAFVHPDLGIGGAERLVVDAAVALQLAGHEVSIFTARHEPDHCFEETRDGTLKVVVYGDFLPRYVFGRFYAACAYVRMCWASLRIVLMQFTSPFDVIIVDQVSICLPILRFARPCGIIFYCHFPDKLLAIRESLVKRLYRIPLDLAEEITTGTADVVFVNSRFTAGVFANAFPLLHLLGIRPDVLYPSLNLEEQDRMEGEAEDLSKALPQGKDILLSINRFERKKNVGLSIEAFALLPEEVRKKTCLVLAGGYDERLPENVEHAAELEALAKKLGVADQVTQMRSVSAARKAGLLKSAACLLYTPDREHLGIVPIEAMYARVPVVAVNTGGPLETIAEGETGFLRPQEPKCWAEAIGQLLGDAGLRKRMGEAGRVRVRERFSTVAFGKQLDEASRRLARAPPTETDKKDKKKRS